MKISRIETIPISVPLNPDLAIKSGRGGLHAKSPFLLVKVRADNGLVGLGEVSCTPRWSGEDQVSAAHFINTYFAPALVGQDPTDIKAATNLFWPTVSGNFFTKSGVEMALWDLVGKAQNKSVYELLGGKVRDYVATKWSVSGLAPDKSKAIAKWAIDKGFKKMKVKVGLGPDDDVARVRAVREIVGPDMKLGVDANGGWPNAEIAIATIKRLREFNIYFAEQPVPAGDPEEMAQVKRGIDIPVVADESIYTMADAQAHVRAKACDVFSIYVGKSGGIGPAMEIAKFAKNNGIACTIGSNLELAVGSAAMVHLGMAAAGVTPDQYPCDIIGPFYYEDKLESAGSDIKPGQVRPSALPGLGVELDDVKVEKYRVRQN
ncbi:MAG TPA: mandelate racemase/muconate lactonizing enzyme family protein [Tepidisphaeraceae bacterium]|nr:mandelate racemase/muconate lactonizing enzyme family protein [Tepidisphaeraceae bacterium]